MFAEWERQRGVVLIYPHIFCDFKDNDLEITQGLFNELILHICRVEDVYLLLHPKDFSLREKINSIKEKHIEIKQNCKILEIATNDLWSRDSVVLSIKDSENETKAHYLNFGFNGWGLKFSSNFDNLINYQLDFLDDIKTMDMILEGGSIDCNGDGLLLTNTQCLLERNRNPHLSKEQIESKLKKYLNIYHVLWLNHGFLKGDDTDSHIDTLARFITKDMICYVKCEDRHNPHFKELDLMEKELQNIAMRFKLRLLALPFCDYIKDGECLPASYVNFLFLNNKTLLLPTYNKPSDFVAFSTLQSVLSDYNIIGINCENLILQHGSLHCVSMQIH